MLAKREKETLKKLINDPAAHFGFKTTDILKFFLCCRIMYKRQKLRQKVEHRRELYFKLGLEHIEKEMDISNIIVKIRTLNFFMKMILDTDQRKLLKLRSSKLIESDESESKSIFTAKKTVNKSKMLNLYIENLRLKEVDERDVKLLRIVGLNEIVEMLK